MRALIRHLRSTALLAVLALTAAACGTTATASERPGAQERGGDVRVASSHDSHDMTDGDVDAAELRVTLERLLGQHVVLATEAMRAGVSGSEDFEAAGEALRRNTEDLTAAIELVYGAEAAEAFMSMWQDHIDFFVQYTVGLAEDDDEAQEQALERLDQYRADFSAFLENATDGNVPAEGAAEGLQVHVDDLVDQIDHYHADDYDAAYDSAYDAYTHMFDVAQVLAGGIAAQMADDMPEGGVDTGGGGTANEQR